MNFEDKTSQDNQDDGVSARTLKRADIHLSYILQHKAANDV